MKPCTTPSFRHSNLCRVANGAIRMRWRKQCVAPCARQSPGVGAKSQCAMFTSWRYDGVWQQGAAMIGRLNHVAIAVRDIAKASAVYRDTLGAEISTKVAQPEHGVSIVFITLPNTKIELLEPLGDHSPITKFLDKNPDGGVHHVCYEVPDIRAARDTLKRQ